MNVPDAHWHLLVNHFPIVGTLLATLVLSYSLLRRNESIRQLAYGLLVLMAVSTLLANATGESAERHLERLRLLDHALVHDHEEAAEWASLVLYMTGLLALLGLGWTKARAFRLLSVLVLAGALLATLMMANVGRLGGLIRHMELRTSATPIHSPAPNRP